MCRRRIITAETFEAVWSAADIPYSISFRCASLLCFVSVYVCVLACGKLPLPQSRFNRPPTARPSIDMAETTAHTCSALNRSAFSLVDDDHDDDHSPTNEGQKMFLQVVELLRLENEVRIIFIYSECNNTHNYACTDISCAAGFR